MNDRLELESVLGGLRDFQRRTVEYVFRRMYLDAEPATRFLVADEVGLGKTMVARGVIAKVIRHLEATVPRIDIVYVCSNAAIANQNLNRLNVFGNRHFAMASRLTLLPAHLKGLKANRINFVSFTPGTTFDLKNRSGVMEERRVLYNMLREGFDLNRTGLVNLLQGTAGKERWRKYAEEPVEIDPELERLFVRELRREEKLLAQVQESAEVFHRSRDFTAEESNSRYSVVSALRRTLARVCVAALEPDLVILDEFQRFKHLLDGSDEPAQLAQELFRQRRARVLLLSATPYKMLTLNHETAEDHYEDFRRTLEFLFGSGTGAVCGVVENLERFRLALQGTAGQPEEEAESAREALERGLRSVMVRTERVPVTENRDAMVDEPEIPVSIKPVDLKQAILVDGVSRALKSWDSIEYWKSCPYLLNLMKEYELKRLLRNQLKHPSSELIDALSRGKDQLLRKGHFERYKELEAANGRLRALMHDTIEAGQWRILWVPPSLPYWRPSGAYSDIPQMTKALVFSAWQVVPDAIAVSCSYEAERRMLSEERDRPKYSSLVRSRKPLLRFSASAEERPTGMPVLSLLYPSPTLARTVDPIAIAAELGNEKPPTAEQVKRRAASQIRGLLQQTGQWPAAQEGREDQRWYWASLAMLDARFAPWMKRWSTATETGAWRNVSTDSDEEPSSGFVRHVELFSAFFDGAQDLGRAPDDLPEVLAELALASPAICALRGLQRVARWVDLDEYELLQAAARIAEGFRSLFNQPDTTALLRAEDTGTPYWRRTIQYALEGNLSAVLDEYFHWLRESLGLVDQNSLESVTQMADVVAEALSVRTSRLEIDQLRVRPRGGTILLDSFGLRCRFAMRFGNVQSDQDDKLARTETIQKAFNSPFRPFILATTSIGQEGLDFHPYCHRVYHWNLPSNPVDLEQREGRIHRYKGHAIRKNVALRHGFDVLRSRYRAGADPWEILFEAAVRARKPDQSDLVPYWVYPVAGGARVERRIPMLPFSREQQRLPDLKASLAVYRLVFGQPRQEDLLAYLKDRDLSDARQWRISLVPPDLPAAANGHPVTTDSGSSLLYCRRCGDAVRHDCDTVRQGPVPQLNWQAGDRVMLFYHSEKNGGPEYCPGEVQAVNGNDAEVEFDDSTRILRYRRADSFWDPRSRESCRLVSHVDLSGAGCVAMVCPKCGKYSRHTCPSSPKTFNLPWCTGDRLVVSYSPAPGIDDDEFPASVVRTAGRVVRVHFDYDDGSSQSIHIAHLPGGGWLDLDYDVPCQLKRE
jgi:hypothetical protein